MAQQAYRWRSPQLALLRRLSRQLKWQPSSFGPPDMGLAGLRVLESAVEALNLLVPVDRSDRMAPARARTKN
jgi:hypothetical protein